jgi:histidinol-phosphate/aromatic aminotransferase/cobyric acid decarboxylase-like protein
MNELDQFDKMVEGFKKIVKKIERWNYKDNKEIQEELSLLKQFSEQQIIMVSGFKKLIDHLVLWIDF